MVVSVMAVVLVHCQYFFFSLFCTFLHCFSSFRFFHFVLHFSSLSCSFMPSSSSSPYLKYFSIALKLQLINFIYFLQFSAVLAWSAIPIQVFSIVTAVSQEQPFLAVGMLLQHYKYCSLNLYCWNAASEYKSIFIKIGRAHV